MVINIACDQRGTWVPDFRLAFEIIRPGPLLTTFISGEYSINQKWVFAFDTTCIYQEEAHHDPNQLLATSRV